MISVSDKKHFILLLIKFYYRSNPLIYFVTNYIENFIKIKRLILNIFSYEKYNKFSMDLVFFFLYYHFNRFCLFWIKFWSIVFIDGLNDMIFNRLQLYFVYSLFIFPLVLNIFQAYISFWLMLLLYYFLLTFFFPGLYLLITL